MPTYGFRCPDGPEFDRFYKTMSSAPAELPCPECGKLGTRQLHGGAGLVFKGSGFYLTDYGKNAHRGEGTKSSTSGSSDSAKSDTKSDTKADTKSDTKPDTKPDAKAKSETAAPKAEPKPSSKPKSE
jgi:putative FmdB family regulatory protein